MRIRNENEEPFEIPLVPMIDMMLVLLIFFLVATTLKDTKPEVAVSLPESKASLEVQVDPKVMVIAIDRAGTRYIDGNPTTTENLHRRLREAAAQDSSQAIQLDIDRDARYQQIVEILDLCQFEGLKNVGFQTRKSEK